MINRFANEMIYPYSESSYDRHNRTKNANSQLRKELFYLWTFIAQQDIWEDALDFLEEHNDLDIPFEMFTD